MTILDQLAGYARERVQRAKEALPLSEIRRQALAQPNGEFAFEKALAKPGMSFICECKKASPSKGLIAPDFPYVEIAREYETAGADCLSVLTEPKWFLGSDAYLKEIARAVSLPCLRKDFTVDEYMLYEAKLLGASAVLLICSLLAIAVSTDIHVIWAASLLTGVGSMIPQIFVPIASFFSRPENKGRNVGIVISGLLTGILASRVISGYVGELLGWREMYYIAAGMMVVVKAKID